MGMINVQKIPSPAEIKNELPLNDKLIKIKAERDEEMAKIIRGESERFLVIIGPCSADNEDAVCEYISRLATIQEKVADKLLLVPRIYTNKPRTDGSGYKGMVHQPDPSKRANMLEGIRMIRSLHIRALSESHLPVADEMLYPENYTYLDDLLSYVAIGARSVENQQHRLTVSGMDIPVGMKNPTSGDFTVLINSMIAAHGDHTFLYNGWETRTSGNPLAHAVVRGAINQYGRNIPNYHYEDLMHLVDLYEESGLAFPAIIVDANHANSMKRYEQQPRIINEVLRNRQYEPELAKIVKGVMIESYLVEGRQDINECIYGKSITDACLGWDESERLIYKIAELA